MKNKKIIFMLIPLFALMLFFGVFNREQEVQEFDYIATLNGVRIPLSEYKVYLREVVINFEYIGGGSHIWKTTIDGISTQVFAKQNALDSIIFIKLTNSYADNIGVYLTYEDKQEALARAEELFDSFTLEEMERIDFYVVVTVMEENILQERVFEEVTRNYALQEERVAVFDHIYSLWLQDAIIEKNIEVWDSIVIAE